MAEIGVGNMYDMCKIETLQKQPMNPEDYRKELVNVGSWFSSNLGTQYYMLLNNELHDYTVFNFINYNFAKAVDELEEVLNSRGAVYGIDFNHDNNYFEFWIVSGDEAHMYILFPCNEFVIDIR
jgi:hypothetical protein